MDSDLKKLICDNADPIRDWILNIQEYELELVVENEGIVTLRKPDYDHQYFDIEISSSHTWSRQCISTNDISTIIGLDLELDVVLSEALLEQILESIQTLERTAYMYERQNRRVTLFLDDNLIFVSICDAVIASIEYDEFTRFIHEELSFFSIGRIIRAGIHYIEELDGYLLDNPHNEEEDEYGPDENGVHFISTV